jgi:hypothetical protein
MHDLALFVSGFGEQRGDSGLIALVTGTRVGAAWLRCYAHIAARELVRAL